MSGRAWTEIDIGRLREMMKAGLSARTIARRLERGLPAVRFKSFKLGLKWKRRDDADEKDPTR